MLKHKSSLPSDPCFGIVKVTIQRLLQLCGESEGKESLMRTFRDLVMLAAIQIGLEHGATEKRHDAQGVMSVGVKLADSEQARENVLRVARKDLERMGHDVAMSLPPALDNLALTIYNNEDVLASLGTVLTKVQRIAALTVNAVDGLAKVCDSYVYNVGQDFILDFMARSIHTPTPLGGY